MVARHACNRVVKEAVALKQRGHVVDGVAQEVMFSFDQFETYGLYHDAEQLKRAVRASRADIIHVHNEPDWMVGFCREATDRPIVFDVHDLESLRWQRPPDPVELAAFAAADGFVHTSDVCAAAAAKYHGTAKPVAVLPCYTNEGFYPGEGADVEPSWGTVVYEGGLSTSSVRKVSEELTEVDMRGHEPIVEAFVSQGFYFHLYPSVPRADSVYENLGAVVSQPLPYPTLMIALRSYGYGFVGGAHQAPLLDAAMPNKLFEYIAQGVVPVVWNCRRAARFVQEHGVGIVLEGLGNLREQLAQGPEIRKRVLAKRREFAMERHIGVVEDLYAQVLGARAAAAA